MQGSIRQRGPNTWQVRVAVGRDVATGRYRYVSRTVDGSKRTAQRLAAQLISEVQQGQHNGQAPKGTVAQLLEQWMAHIQAHGRSPSTLARYRSAIRSNILPVLGRHQVNRLMGSDLDTFYAGLLAKGLSPLTVRKCHAILSAALRQAIRWGWLERNPIDRASPPSTRNREIVPPTIEEVRQLLDAAERSNPDLASLIYAAVTTGCRRGELCALRWHDVDLDLATAVIAHSISDTTGELSMKSTKTHQARRIALDPSTVEVLRRQRRLAEERAAAAGVKLAPSAYVWSQELDSSAPWRPLRVTSAFQVLRDRLGLRHITFHALRHFAATTLAGRGVAVRTIAGRLGHSNPTVTLRTYAHFLEAADREAAAVMETLAAQLRPRESLPDNSPST